MIKYIKSVLWRVAKCLSYIEEARCLKVKSVISGVGFLIKIGFLTALHVGPLLYLNI